MDEESNDFLWRESTKSRKKWVWDEVSRLRKYIVCRENTRIRVFDYEKSNLFIVFIDLTHPAIIYHMLSMSGHVEWIEWARIIRITRGVFHLLYLYWYDRWPITLIFEHMRERTITCIARTWFKTHEVPSAYMLLFFQWTYITQFALSYMLLTCLKAI